MSKYTFDAKHRCLEKGEAACTYYRLALPSTSSLVNEDCVTIEETTQELYNITSEINGKNDFSGLGNSCITYNEATAGLPTAKEVAEAFEKEICDLKTTQSEEISSICNLPTADCGLDLKTLVDSCNTLPTTFGTLLQTLIDEIDTLKTKVAALEAANP